MIIAIPSKGRPGKTKTDKIFKSGTMFVPQNEEPAYKKLANCKIVAVPNEVRGITKTRNWILENSDDRQIVFLDDDVKSQGFVRLNERNSKHEKLNESQWLSEFEKLFQINEEIGSRIWGIATQSAPRSFYPWTPFLFKSYITASCMGMVNDGLRFDESFQVKEDYELALRCFKEDGVILCARYIYWENSHWHDEGGCKEYRTQEMERVAIQRLKKMYPGQVKIAKRSNSEWTISIL